MNDQPQTIYVVECSDWHYEDNNTELKGAFTELATAWAYVRRETQHWKNTQEDEFSVWIADTWRTGKMYQIAPVPLLTELPAIPEPSEDTL